MQILSSRRRDDVDHQHVRIADQDDAAGQFNLARQDLGALLDAFDRHGQAVGDRQRLRLDLDRGGVLGDQGAGCGFTLDGDGDLDGHLLASTDHDQVDVLDIAAHRMHREGFGQRQLFSAIEIEAQDRVGSGVAQHRGVVAGIKFEVLGFGAVAVEHRGDLAFAPRLAGCPLAGASTHCDAQFVGGGAFCHCDAPALGGDTARRGRA